MIFIKKKSLVVALVSSIVIFAVLVLTLVGYIISLELKSEELKRAYEEALHRINARFYSKYVEISKLNAKIEPQGPLKGNPVIEGMVRNNGHRNISDLLIRVKFLDKDGARIYEVVFHPQEPSLGNSDLTQLNIPYLYGQSPTIIKPNDTLPFKRILNNCPSGIVSELKAGGFARGGLRWSGKFASEILSLKF